MGGQKCSAALKNCLFAVSCCLFLLSLMRNKSKLICAVCIVDDTSFCKVIRYNFSYLTQCCQLLQKVPHGCTRGIIVQLQLSKTKSW